MAGERRTWVAVALVVVAALLVARAKLGCGAASHEDLPEPAAIAERPAAVEDAPLLDAGPRPPPRPLEELFVYAQAEREPPPDAQEHRPSPAADLHAAQKPPSSHEAPADPARLRELGLLPQGAPEAAGPARVLLERAGRALTFQARSPEAPARNDELLRALAALAGPALAGVQFEQLAPGGADGDFVLRASSPTTVLRAHALNFGPWYDLDSVLGVLNVVLRDDGSEMRFVALVTEDAVATVVAGPEAGLQLASAEGLIEVGEASFAMNAGRSLEERDGGPAP